MEVDGQKLETLEQYREYFYLSNYANYLMGLTKLLTEKGILTEDDLQWLRKETK